jgi:hypothetical protein
MSVIPALTRQRQEESGIQISLDYRARHCLSQKKKSFSSSRASVFQEAMVEVLSGDLFFGILLGAL